MSAGMGGNAAEVSSDLTRLAPKFRAAVEAALAECNAGPNGGLRAKVYEAYRSPELQAVYYARGRTIIPPTRTVTNAPSNLHSWHGYGLAVDVVHKEDFWEPPRGARWFEAVAEIFKKHGCKWGGDWKDEDLPHFQWGRCKASPSAQARKLIQLNGIASVWDAVGAM